MDDPANDELVYLADKGDLILAVRDASLFNYRRFLVSSTTVSLASRVFAAMLGPHFKEGRQLQESAQEGSTAEPVTIPLEEDDVAAMDFILSNIHFRADRFPQEFTAEEIAHIAVQSDKSDCNAVVASWARLWCDPEKFPIDDEHKARDMGYGLLVGWLFQSPNCTAMTAKYIKDLPADFLTSWKRYELLSRLPETLRDKLAADISAAQAEIGSLVLSTLPNLLRYTYPCLNSHPFGVTVAYPPTQFIEALREQGIFPSIRPFETLSVNEAVALVEGLWDIIKHECFSEESWDCLYREELLDLLRDVSAVRYQLENSRFC